MADDIRKKVREGYGKIARGEGSHYTTGEASCCGSPDPGKLSKKIGYSEDEMNEVPDGANLGLGCGNPVALASLKKGETVLDLGSGGGFDCFLAANQVGPDGKIIGVDMTDDMLKRARDNARKGEFDNVEFRKGFIEDLPVDDSEMDAIISNCVINLSTEKDKVFSEAFRVLKPGGRLMVSDLVLEKDLPEELIGSISAHVGCIAGADLRERYLKRFEKAGFCEVSVISEEIFPLECISDTTTIEQFLAETGLSIEGLTSALSGVRSIKVRGYRPR